MAYVNVAEWTSQHVGDWLYGLDDSILPYVQFFVNNQINGCRLLLLSAQDLLQLNIHKIGHQEIILEAVELLRNLHYNISSETLQTIALRLACKSRALFNQLKKCAEKAAAAAAAMAAASANIHQDDHNNNNNNEHNNNKKHDKNKDKDKDKDLHNNNINNNNNQTNETIIVDMSPVSTSTLASVSDILSAVKDLISWIDRYPFDGQDKYVQARKAILQLAIELTSTAQRDQQFVQAPNEVIRQSCKKLADLCDRLVQELNDSLAMQAASLEVVTVTKNMDEDLGMHIHSSYSGIHVVGGLKFDSPAHLNGNIEEGDEIVQINYQTVVGWQLKKLVASMRRFPTKLILTVKKRPRHHQSGSFTILPQFALPLPEMSIIGNSSLPIGSFKQSNFTLNNTNVMNVIPSNRLPSSNHLQESVQQPQQQHQYQTQQSFVSQTIENQNSIQNKSTIMTSVPSINAKIKVNHDEPKRNIDQSIKKSSISKHCTSSDDSSSLSDLSYDDNDSSSTFSTDSESDTDNSNCGHHHRHHRHHHHHQQHKHTHRISQNRRNNNCKNERKQKIKLSNNTTTVPSAEQHTTKQNQIITHDCCSTDHGSEYEIEDIDNDNDSAFYSGHRTTTSASTSTSSSKNEDSLKSSNDNRSTTTTVSTATTTNSTVSSQKIKNLTASLVKIGISKSKLKETESVGENDSVDSGIRVREDNENNDRNITKPRTSAEFEELYLSQRNDSNFSKITNKIDNRTQLTSVQLSTITHLTSLAKNIRFANMAPVQNRTSASPWMINNTHSKTKFDPVLARQIEKTIHRLSDGDLVMGDYEGYLYTYKGSERIGGNSADFPSLGVINDPKQLEKWSKIRSVLRDNCFYAYQNDLSVACFEIPIHLPGYYILVDKQMLISEHKHPQDDSSSSSTVKQLVVFKLVTYHRLFMFAVDSLAELVRWIVRFGYRFCCNPTEPQLCFTFYLSPAHIGELPSSSSSSSTLPKSFLELSESDDYNDLLTVKSNDSNDGSNHVKFQTINGRDSSSTSDDSNRAEKDLHRFIKSPHPKGSIRFAVCRSGQERDFIDATIDVKKILAQNLESNLNVETKDSSNVSIVDQMPRPKPRISKMAVMNASTTDTSSSSTTSIAISSKTSSMITSAAQRLAPIPVPEKSTHISQTIQHFANLQRQNNLRRSFAQQQQQQQQQQQNHKNCTIPSKNTKVASSNQQLNYGDYDYIINNRPKPCIEDSSNSNPVISNHNTIGNPLYCHVSPNIQQQSQVGNGESSSSSSSSSDQDESRSSLPPAIDPPPPPPRTINSENSEWSNPLNSPRLQAKRPSKKQIPLNTPPIVPPKPSRNDSRKDAGETPPTLLPRRPSNQNQPPPPLPTTSHPQLSRSNSTKQQQNQSAPPIPPPVCPKPDLIKCLAETKSGAKFLNRSFSDAAYQSKQLSMNTDLARPSLKSRHSLESNRSSKQNDDDDDDDHNNNDRLFYRSGSAASFGDMLSSSINNSGWDISPTSTGRSLPTMGVSMLAKKRLSNVSADSSAIEKAINLHHANTSNS